MNRDSLRENRCQALARLAILVVLMPLNSKPALGSLGDQLHELLASDGATSDYFGQAVSISGDRAIVGAIWDDDRGNNSGSAYLFDVDTGRQIRKLIASDGATNDWFGQAVSMSAGTAIVGAYGDDDRGINAGSAYLFSVSSGTELRKLLPPDGSTTSSFGFSVGISNNVAIVGAYVDTVEGTRAGSAYLFDVTSGAPLRRLTASDGESFDHFGYSVGISGPTAIVGAANDDDLGTFGGSAYLFDVDTGRQLAKLVASDGEAFDHFGRSVSIMGDYALVGAPNDSDLGANSGSAYVFDVTTGDQLFKLTPSDGDASDLFGYSVDISGSTAIIGAYRDEENGRGAGSAYIFDLATGTQLAKLTSADATSVSAFGYSVGIEGDRALIGAYTNYGNAPASGSAYLFNATIPEPGTLLMAAFAGVGMLLRRSR